MRRITVSPDGDGDDTITVSATTTDYTGDGA